MTPYREFINDLLRPRITEKEMVLDLFAGSGGLSLGFEAAGYRTIGYEMDAIASDTYNKNLTGDCYTAKLYLDYDYPKADIIIGGPPCQPFSVGGNQKGIKDSRDGFPIFIDAIRRVQPRVFLFENVRGLLYANKWYFELILNELSSLGYIIEYKLINAVHYGVPQNRERLFVIGHRASFAFPKIQHKKITVGESIGDTMYDAPEGSKFLTASMDAYIAKYEKASECINPRDLNSTKPARTLTCRNLGGATGDMQRVRLNDGRRRRLFDYEAARLQTFPDWFVFSGSETQRYYQIGNAVPPYLAYQVASSLKDCFKMGELYSADEVIKMNLKPNNILSLFGHE